MSGPDCETCGEYFLDCHYMSRPEIPINWDKVDELLMYGCPGTEIAAFFGVHENTFYHRVEKKYDCGFSEYSAKKKATGEAILREHQFKKAIGATKKGDNTLLIFLGKQRLGQRDNPSDKLVSEEVMKAFNELMKQLDHMQEARKSVEKTQPSSIGSEPTIASSGPMVSSNKASMSNCMTNACNESPFR
jgi:predicted nucleic-acid-binding Zn-ribbon protein